MVLVKDHFYLNSIGDILFVMSLKTRKEYIVASAYAYCNYYYRMLKYV